MPLPLTLCQLILSRGSCPGLAIPVCCYSHLIFTDFDLDEIYDRGSVVSGKSSSLGDSADPSEDFKSSSLVVSRTVSCPESMTTMVKSLCLENPNTTEQTTTNGDTESQTNDVTLTESL